LPNGGAADPFTDERMLLRRARKRGAVARNRRVTARINEQLGAGPLRLVAEDGTQLGVMSGDEARAYAYARELDVVEIAATSDPPVCRVVDYGKWRYAQERKLRESQKRQAEAQVRLKEVRLPVKLSSHDYAWKREQTLDFLRHGTKVKAVVRFKGREREHPERGVAMIDRLAADVRELGRLEGAPVSEGRTMTAVIAPVGAKR
jgi:translation initiation factor IF-3